MDKDGLLNSQGLWNRRGALLVGAVAGCALVGYNYFYFEEMLAALVLFAAVWLPLLFAAFLLATLERAGEIGFAQVLESLEALRGAARRRLAPFPWARLWERLSDAFFPGGGRAMGVAEVRAVSRIDQSRRRMQRACGPSLRQHRRDAA